MDIEKDQNAEKSNTADNRIVNAGHFSSTNQPSPEAKSAGWWKKRKGKDVLKALLQLKFDGSHLDSLGQIIIPNKIRQQASLYFGVPEAYITVEMIAAMKQLAMAIQTGDTNAFNAIWEKAYGKTKESDDDGGDGSRPIINIMIAPPALPTEVDGGNDSSIIPDILEEEPDNE